MDLPNLPKIDIRSPAQRFYDSLAAMLKDIRVTEEALTRGVQRAVLFHTAAGDVIRVGKIGYRDSNLIYVGGINLRTGHQTVVLAHSDSVQLFIELLESEAPQEPQSKIGFPELVGEVASNS